MTLPSLLITRPQASATRFAAGLARDVRQRVKIVTSPLFEIVPTGIRPDLSRYAGIIFTSSNAVALAPKVNHRPAYCVGHIAAERAKAAGWTIFAEEQTAEHLIARISEMAPAGPLLHLAGKHRRGDIAARLTALGITTEVHVLYDQNAVDLSAEAHALLKGAAPVIVPLFSPRSAALFVDQTPHLHNVIIVAMSDAVALCCQGLGAARILVVAAPTGQEMLRTVEKVVRSSSLA
tara:strand:+ start:122 stop:826 length:705 start_codon:yes stop_codon:yes gene_type:complete